MVTRSKASSNGAEPKPFDFSSLRRVPHHVWREIEREDAPPLRCKVLELSNREAEEIPIGVKVPLRDALEVCAPYVVEWDFQAVNLATGETVLVPPPAEVGVDVFELLTNEESGAILSWLKYPQQMRTLADQKKLKGSANTRV